MESVQMEASQKSEGQEQEGPVPHKTKRQIMREELLKNPNAAASDMSAKHPQYKFWATDVSATRRQLINKGLIRGTRGYYRLAEKDRAEKAEASGKKANLIADPLSFAKPKGAASDGGARSRVQVRYEVLYSCKMSENREAQALLRDHLVAMAREFFPDEDINYVETANPPALEIRRMM